MLLRGVEIAGQSVATIEQNMRRDFTNHGIHPLSFPARGIEWPPPVIPQNIEIWKERDQLPDTGVGLMNKSLPVRRVFQGIHGVGSIKPVVQTVIKPDFEISFAGVPLHIVLLAFVRIPHLRP